VYHLLWRRRLPVAVLVKTRSTARPPGEREKDQASDEMSWKRKTAEEEKPMFVVPNHRHERFYSPGCRRATESGAARWRESRRCFLRCCERSALEGGAFFASREKAPKKYKCEENRPATCAHDRTTAPKSNKSIFVFSPKVNKRWGAQISITRHTHVAHFRPPRHPPRSAHHRNFFRTRLTASRSESDDA
jgi:hypothetical protein